MFFHLMHLYANFEMVMLALLNSGHKHSQLSSQPSPKSTPSNLPPQKKLAMDTLFARKWSSNLP
jgi:hypothetical protein